MMSPSCLEVILVGFVLVLPFLYETSRSFRYYLKFVIYYIVVSTNAVILIPVMLFRPGDVKNFLWASSLCHHLSTLFGLQWELRGRRHLEKEQACVIVANHQSCLDILGMFDIWPIMDKCTVVAKKELFYAWPFGLAAWLCGIIYIDRMNSEQARSILDFATQRIKNKKIKLWVFPEGTRRNTGEIHSFKKGAFHVAINSQLPILPIVFSSYYFLNKEKKKLDPGKIVITTLPPIPTEGLTKKDLDTLMEKTRTSMSEVLQTTNRELQLLSVTSNAQHF